MKRVNGIAFAAAIFCTSCAPVSPPATIPAPPAATPDQTSRPTASPQHPVTNEPVPLDFEVRREPNVDVGLAWDLRTLVLEPSRPATLRISSPGFESVVDEAATRLEARTLEVGWEITWQRPDGEPGSIVPSASETLWVAVKNGTVAWNGKTWRGVFKLFGNPRESITLALRLPMETYLLGVVPGEIGALSDELIQAGRAQAIAARSYSMFYRGRRAAEGFDMYGTVEDQLYVPIEREAELATRCVVSTRGLVALYDSSPVRANYSSTCGGITSEVWEAWPAEPLPYLTSHRDAGDGQDYCSVSRHHRWKEEWPVEEFLGNLQRFGREEGVAVPRELGELIDVQVEARSRSGRVWSLRARTDGGDVVVPGRRLRWVLRRPGRPQSILRSNLFKIDVRRDARTGRARAVVASGAGAGHGVGLCQMGARAMARAGISAQGILHHYYTDIDIERSY